MQKALRRWHRLFCRQTIIERKQRNTEFRKGMLIDKMNEYEKLKNKISRYHNCRALADFMTMLISYLPKIIGFKKMYQAGNTLFHEGRLAAKMANNKDKTKKIIKRGNSL